MNLAVRLYSNATQSEIDFVGVVLPNQWPVEVIELGTGTELPGPEWILMTTEEYEAHRSQYLNDYTASFNVGG